MSGADSRKNEKIHGAGPVSIINPFEFADSFQDDLRLISLKPQLAKLKQAGFRPLKFAKII